MSFEHVGTSHRAQKSTPFARKTGTKTGARAGATATLPSGSSRARRRRQSDTILIFT